VKGYEMDLALLLTKFSIEEHKRKIGFERRSPIFLIIKSDALNKFNIQELPI